MKTRLFLLFYFLAAFAVLGFTNVSPRPGVNWDLGASTNQWNALYVKTGVFSGPIIGNGSGLTNLLNVGSGESNAFYILLMTTNALPNSIAIHTLFNASNFVTRVQLAGSNFVDQTDLNSSNFATYPIIATSNFVNFTQLAGSNFLTGAGLSSSNYVTMPWLAGSNFVNFTQLAGSNFITGTALAGYNYATFVNIAGSNFANFTQIAGSNFVNFTQLAGSNFTSQANIGSSNFANFTQIAGSNFTSQANIGSSNFVNFTQLAGSNFTSQANIGSSNFANFTQIAGSNFTSQANIGSSNFVTQVGLAGSNYVNNMNGKATNISTYGPFQSLDSAVISGLATVANNLGVSTNIICAGTIFATNTSNGRYVSMDSVEGSITLGGDKRTNWPTTTTGPFIENNNGKGTNTTIYGRLTINTQLYVFTNQVYPVNTRATNGITLTSTTNVFGIINEVYELDGSPATVGTNFSGMIVTNPPLLLGGLTINGGPAYYSITNNNSKFVIAGPSATLAGFGPEIVSYSHALKLWLFTNTVEIRSNLLVNESIDADNVYVSGTIQGDVLNVLSTINATNVTLHGNLIMADSSVHSTTNALEIGTDFKTNTIIVSTNESVTFSGSLLATNPSAVHQIAGTVNLSSNLNVGGTLTVTNNAQFLGNVTMTNGTVSLTNLTSPTGVINFPTNQIVSIGGFKTNSQPNSSLSYSDGNLVFSNGASARVLISGVGALTIPGDLSMSASIGNGLIWGGGGSIAPNGANGINIYGNTSKLLTLTNGSATFQGAILQTNPASISSFAGPVNLSSNLNVGGFLTQTQAAWDDIRISGSSMKLPASGNPTPKDFAGTVQALAFDKNTMNSAGFELQLPHGINTNYGTHIHIHWACTNAASTNCVVWGIEYTMANPQSVFNPVTTTMYVTNAPGTNWFQQLPEFPTIYGFKESAVMVSRVFRDAANSADSHDDDAYLLSVDAHYVRKAFGSANELGDY